MISRRSIVGGLSAILGGGKQAAEAVAGQLAFGKPPSSTGMNGLLTGAGYIDSEEEVQLDIKRQLKYIARLATPEERERVRREIVITRLDPDLVVNRSMSLSAKYQIQREREVERSMVEHTSGAERYLKLLYERLTETKSIKL